MHTGIMEACIGEKGSLKHWYIKLPASRYELVDELDKARIYGESFASVSLCDVVPELENPYIKNTSLDKLNLLAERVSKICESNFELAALRALLQQAIPTGELSLDEVLNMTYGLDSVQVYPCENAFEYGKIVMENNFLEELADISDEVYNLLDPLKVGELMLEMTGGVFVDGYLVNLSDYESKEHSEIESQFVSENWIFKLDLVSPKDGYESLIETITLPVAIDRINEVKNRLNTDKIEDCICIAYESYMPQITQGIIEDMDNFMQLNAISYGIAQMSRQNFAKLKAVFEVEKPLSVSEIGYTISHLHEWEFDSSISKMDDFGKAYLTRMMPTNFDFSLLNEFSSYKFSKDIASKLKASFTDYGMLSAHNCKLYTAVVPVRTEEENQFVSPSM